MATPKKRVLLTLGQKVEAIKLLDSGKAAYKIAEDLGVGKTQIQNLRKRKREILDDFENNLPSSTKRRRHITGNEEVNKLVLEFFKDAVSRRIIVNGPILKEKALQFAEDLGISSFKGSNGWLESFLKRNGISFGTQSGERGDVDIDTVADWKLKLSTIIQDYDLENVFNMDETGLFFKDTTRKTFYFKGEDCAGGKKSKERITVALCSSVSGEKLPPLIIGKAEKPRCFSKIDKSTLPVNYYSNKKAWMTRDIFNDWLQNLNRKMRRKNRKILLFLDNTTSHSEMDLSHVKLKFFPPNTTSHTQPMDQGIIQATKLKFRKKQLLHMIKTMDLHPSMSGPDLLKKTSVLDAIYWMNAAWNEVQTSTIEKCFSRCGFVKQGKSEEDCQEMGMLDTKDDEDDDDDDDIPLAALKKTKDIFGCEFNELVDIDSNVHTCNTEVLDWGKSACEILNTIDASCTLSDDSDDEDSSEVDSLGICSISDASFMLEKLLRFAKHHGSALLYSSLMKADEEVAHMNVKKSKQAVISDFFTFTRS
ncbi:hypothetical protein FSP39_007460 [Pinctada imbricata]|uniref:HTH CENPB-type domain-containing protein n=1 Tax=Pinctada imbricata TaxID=66713 RepID=A0AA88YT82_PINIB|nr:hypothetical protein FSP39_007460 [Pinctada imbricata]